MTALLDAPARTVDGLRWWRSPSGTWLEVTITGQHGRATDLVDAVDYCGPASWVSPDGARVYLEDAEVYADRNSDAARFLELHGLSSGEVPTVSRDRRPNGAVDGVQDPTAIVDPQWVDEPAYEVIIEPIGVAADDEAITRTIGRLREGVRPARGDRKIFNRVLAAHVRAAGGHPQGDVWDAAVALAVAGVSLAESARQACNPLGIAI